MHTTYNPSEHHSDGGSRLHGPFDTGRAGNDRFTSVNVLCRTTGTTTFAYTGNAQTFTVPANVTSITIDASGAEGGMPNYNQYCGSNPDRGGKGGNAQGRLGGHSGYAQRQRAGHHQLVIHGRPRNERASPPRWGGPLRFRDNPSPRCRNRSIR
jgi:hypothetical protein